MYLLLIIYSITNLNVVSWGTREVAVKKTKKELAEEKRAAEAAVKKSKKGGVWGLLQGQGIQEEEEGGVDFSLGNVLRIMLFTQKKENSQERDQLIRIADSLDTLSKRLDHIEGVIGTYLIEYSTINLYRPIIKHYIFFRSSYFKTTKEIFQNVSPWRIHQCHGSLRVRGYHGPRFGRGQE